MNARPDPKKTRTQGAIRANMRAKENRYAELLLERGWAVVSPHQENLDDITRSKGWEKRAVEMLLERGWKLVPDED